MKPFNLPPQLKFGTATAALQIEGGDTRNNWYRFCEQNRTKDGTHCIVADDHWNRYEEDIGLMQEMNQQLYRMSVEWSRIEPEPGRFDEEALRHYRNEIGLLIDRGIQPLVTLHHFSHPIWFEDKGGWENPDSVACFKRFCDKVVSSIGDLVAEWVTINEPNVYVEGTYSSVIYPGGKASVASYFKAAKHMALAHIEAYRLIHRIRSQRGFPGTTLVGVANHLRVFETEPGSRMAKLPRKLLEYGFHTLFLESMVYGQFKFPLGFGGYPLGKGVFCDFMGINYYSRDIVAFSWNPARLFSDLRVKEGAPTNDMGWEIYPEGLYRVCKTMWEKYRKPIFITENGICDARDAMRTRFLYDHLQAVARLCEDGVQVERYYHWSLLDNFEWNEGLTPRFGLIEVDYDTQKRTIRQSGRLYGEISKAKAVTQEMVDRYLKAERREETASAKADG